MRMFSSAKPAPIQQTLDDNTETPETEKTETNLNFVSGESNLRQVFMRSPEDGFFPLVKHIDEMEAADVEPLVKNDLKDILKKLVNRDNLEPKLTHALVSQLHDKDGRMIERIYERLLRERLTNDECVGEYMEPIHYNMMMQSAAVFKRHRLLAQLILETTVLDVPVDTQTYIKTVIASHYDRGNKSSAGRPWGKDNLAYLYTLFEKDVPKEDYKLASVML